MMGATGRVPGAFTAADVPAALQRLESGIQDLKAQAGSQGAASQQTAALPADNEDSPADADEDDKDPPIDLAVRAIPLIGLLRRAAAAKAEVMWETT